MYFFALGISAQVSVLATNTAAEVLAISCSTHQTTYPQSNVDVLIFKWNFTSFTSAFFQVSEKFPWEKQF